jgi:5-methylthioribose kinase
MSNTDKTAYRELTITTVADYLSRQSCILAHLGPNAAEWKVREIGDGNLNLVFIVESTHGAVIIKQALPYIRARGPESPLPLSRAFFEYEATTRHSDRAPGMTPALYLFDKEQATIVMEYLSPHIILRKGLVSGIPYPRLAECLGHYLARIHFRGSDLSMDSASKKMDAALFAGNHALCRISEQRIFTEPYYAAKLNRWTSPQLDGVVQSIRQDESLKAAVNELKDEFMCKSQTLLHGDFHSGSVMVTENDVKVIDPEFAFYGPMGFDVGAIIGNLFISYCAQPGHADTSDDRSEYSRWILTVIQGLWTAYETEFRKLWLSERTGELYPETAFPQSDSKEALNSLSRYLKSILADSFGFAGAKMIRRIIGVSHVEDMTTIEDLDLRAACESRTLSIARALILKRHRLANVQEAIMLAENSEAMGSDEAGVCNET